jgi:hypothetical protein
MFGPMAGLATVSFGVEAIALLTTTGVDTLATDGEAGAIAGDGLTVTT